MRFTRFFAWYSKKETVRYWMARCPACGWKGLTSECGGFDPIGDTGDYAEGTCPLCISDVEGVGMYETHWALWIWRWLTLWTWMEAIARRREDARYAAYMEKEWPNP